MVCFLCTSSSRTQMQNLEIDKKSKTVIIKTKKKKKAVYRPTDTDVFRVFMILGD